MDWQGERSGEPSRSALPTLPAARPRRRRRATRWGQRAKRPAPLLLACLVLLATLLPLAAAAPECIRFADYDSINQMFIDGGPGTKVLLCPRKTYRLSGTVVFTAADQELATYGYPNGADRAVLRVESPAIATAVQGDCRRCARVSIRNLVIDGNRAKLGRMADEDAATGLVVLGGNEGQSVRDSWITDPRGFTAVHIREGDKLGCRGAIVENNEIGPAGDEYDPAVDGPDPELSPLGRPLADGISIACRDSTVRGNTLWDNTDAGIVVYCSPGTAVAGNTISARSASSMGGILMVDHSPFDGDYAGLRVEGNTIDARARVVRVGIGIGASVWSDDTETVLRGGSVLGNALKGQFMGFGIAAAGIDGWTIKDNWSEARHAGKRSARCFDEPVNPDPVAFLYHATTVDHSEVQDDFVDHEFAYIACIDGVDDNSPDPPAAVVPEPAVEVVPEPEPEPEAPSTGSVVMDDILLHSQLRMLEAIDGLGLSIERAILDNSGPVVVDGADASAAMERLRVRVDRLEAEQLELITLAGEMSKTVKQLIESRTEYELWQHDALQHIQQGFYQDADAPYLKVDPSASGAAPPPPAAPTATGIRQAIMGVGGDEGSGDYNDEDAVWKKSKYRRGPPPKVLAKQYAEAAARLKRERDAAAAQEAWISPATKSAVGWGGGAGVVGAAIWAVRRAMSQRQPGLKVL